MAPDEGFEVRIAGSAFDPLDVDSGGHSEPSRVSEAGVGHYLVQFFEALTEADFERLRGAGLALNQYVPKLAYLESLTVDQLSGLRSDPLLRAVVPYSSEFKRSPYIGQMKLRSAGRLAKPGTWLELELFHDADLDETVSRLQEMGVLELTSLDRRGSGGTARIRCVVPGSPGDPETAGGLGVLAAYLERASALPSVKWISEVPDRIEDNTKAAAVVQSGRELQSIWDRGLCGQGQVIGIMDSSPVDLGHCFFRGEAGEPVGPSHRKVISVRNASGTEPERHATFVAGCAAGDDLRHPGKSLSRGGAWAARLVAGNWRDLELADVDFKSELEAAAAAGATIHNNSWHDLPADGGSIAPYNRIAADVDAFTWENEEHLVLGSAGNTGENQGPPGTSKNAICVAGVKMLRATAAVSSCDGCPGPTDDGRRKPDLVAPGGGVKSAKVGTGCGMELHGTCASSFATPHAAAAAALVRQYFTEGWFPSGRRVEAQARKPSGALLKAALICSTRNVLDEGGYARAERNCPQREDGYPSHKDGWGLICLDRVLFFEDSAHRLTVSDVRHADGVSTGSEHKLAVEVPEGSRVLKVVLVWSDPPATLGVQPLLVNDLDLSVESPGGDLFSGSAFAEGFSTPNGPSDTLNSVEVVQVKQPRAGSWKVKVRGSRVSVGVRQGYAVVATVLPAVR